MSEIVVGYDGSSRSEPALRAALQEAARRRCRLRVLRVWRTAPYVAAVPGYGYEPLQPLDDIGQHLTEAVQESLAKAMADAGLENVDATVDARPGDAGTHLVEASRNADLLVIGTRHHGAFLSALMGSVTSYVLHHSACPVLVVGAEAPATWDQVLVGVDGSEPSLEALRWAAREASLSGCRLVVLHAWELMSSPDWVMMPFPEPALYDDQVRHWLQDLLDQHVGSLEVPVETRAVHKRAVDGLVEAASSRDLLVVAARGRGRFDQLMLGSVSHGVLHHAKSSVAVLRPVKRAS